MFIINIEAIEHNAKTLKNFGCNAKNNSDSTIKVLVYQNGNNNNNNHTGMS